MINAFNLTDEPQQLEFTVPLDMLGTAQALPVKGADAYWGADAVKLQLTLSGMSPELIEIGVWDK